MQANAAMSGVAHNMKSEALPAPGIVFGPYPERSASNDAAVRRHVWGRPGFLRATLAKRFTQDVQRAQQRREQLVGMSDAERDQSLLNLRAQMSRHGLSDDLVIEAFAHISVLSEREIDMVPFDMQLFAAKIILDNRLAEMATGEGKTLVAAISAATAALAGIPVHVMTSNDYLVERDAEKLRPLYQGLGLKVDFVTQAMQAERRRQAYSADITYCTAKELTFDYLRDTMIRRGMRSDLHLRVARLVSHPRNSRDTVMRGLCMAIVDEADSILIDEARVPLILASKLDSSVKQDVYGHALHIARTLVEFTDFRLNANGMVATLTNAGRRKVEKPTVEMVAMGRNRLHREELVCQALAALHLYQRDKHYLVDKAGVTIIDEMTGRVAPGRIWSRGLHQLIEHKERCEISDDQVTSAQITFQRFFQKYLCLGGMSGTISEARNELSSVYGLDVVTVPLRCKSLRRLMPTVIYPDRTAQSKTVVSEVRRLRQIGQPVLIGTDSVADSEQLSALLDMNEIAHTVLNARQDRSEADIVAQAGTVGRVTVATNMAGRGTDIPLGPGSEIRGGLHVISCQHNTSRRIDRQLIGRCARQGDPGSAQTFICFDQPLFQRSFPQWLRKVLSRANGLSRPRWLVGVIARLPQILEENRQRTQRREMLEQDLKLDQKLSSIEGFD
ncbi:MAG: prepilin peptidase [Betaproteobacteria bacterium]|nr:MAG: prepilin peptidase [Betaproteobacteria bacterium]